MVCAGSRIAGRTEFTGYPVTAADANIRPLQECQSTELRRLPMEGNV